jgi:hypothetical protein
MMSRRSSACIPTAVGGARCRRVPPDEEDEDYHVVREEADVAMEDATPPSGAGDLPPGVPDGRSRWL